MTLHYALTCPVCGWQGADDGLALGCPRSHAPGLLQTSYKRREFTPRPQTDGMFRYRDWLPVRRTVPDAGSAVVYPATRLGAALGLPDLWVSFSGYWPERGARLETATFKELEAYCVLGRLPENPPTLVVASVGNTAAAFARLCSRHALPCVVVVPETGVERLEFTEPLAPCVRLLALEGADYAETIAYADALALRMGGQVEGGTRNVARRAGLGTVWLSAVEAMPRPADVYVQAVGSAAGAIAVHEAADRLVRAGASEGLPRLMLCQNAEYAPLYDAWRAERDDAIPDAGERPEEAAERCLADELTNARPPYAVAGGVRDCLTGSNGRMLLAGREDALAAGALFAEVEGVDIEPAAAVALAGLRRAVQDRTITPDDSVLLNITGGGRGHMRRRLQPTRAAHIHRVRRAERNSDSFSRDLLHHCEAAQATTRA
ncbi:cysteate synthase [Streptomyces sp. CA-278952]|uniref:cysteate synthase n=1 Tax=unclassified Streptomyces TaxID=2593676 RepID=UPI00236840E8|nr:cysteate synthase [Streptomyces sp. CA-278952]WDG27025.1 cysteate synthase [Streptomyces sp. CA-278952]